MPSFAYAMPSGSRGGGAEASHAPSDPIHSPADSAPLVEMTGITKRFGALRANDDISLSLLAGEIQAVLGENGAGKTTLMNILSGMYHPDSGTITIGGHEVEISSPSDALRLGIGTVYQHFTLVPNLSVIENVILGLNTGFVLDLSAAERRVREMLGDFELAASPRTEVRHLSLGERQRVEIIKVLFRGSKVLLLDEPTSVLTPVEVEGLFKLLLRLKSEGVAVVLITHKLEEALEVSDRVSVLRQGRKVGELLPGEIENAGRGAARRRIVEMMFGTAGQLQAPNSRLQAPRSSVVTPSILLELRGVSALDNRGAKAVRNVSLELRAGEILGIAGVDGNGQKELGEVIAGQRHVTSGHILIDRLEITNRGVAAATKAGAGYVTDDRLGEGAVPGASVADNMVLKSISQSPFSRSGFWLNRNSIESHANTLIEEFNVKTPSPSTRITLLSGGNIQKVLLARELAMEPKVLVCNKPTNGLDLKTAEFVLRTLREQADRGKAVLLISSELDELMEISDRIGVMYNGALVALFSHNEADVEAIGHYMLAGALPLRATA